MMGYGILTHKEGKLIIVDGGNRGDASQLRKFIELHGNRVSAWFITHPHPDHVDALTAILEEPNPPVIDFIYTSLPDQAWFVKYESNPPKHLESFTAFRRALDKSGLKNIDIAIGDRIWIDGVLFKILGIKNPKITSSAINNSSMVFKVSGINKSIIFLGDLELEGGVKLLKNTPLRSLQADYVQMAHHGANGVGLPVYQAIKPKACLWPTPIWLWENNSGNGPGSGPFDTLTTRKWMNEMGIQDHYVSAFGTQYIE